LRHPGSPGDAIRVTDVFSSDLPGNFLVSTNFRAKNSKKIAANVGKSPLCRRFHDEASAGIPKWIQPIMPLPAWSEIFFGQKFLVRKFVGRIFFGSKFEKSKKSWRESWKKRC